MLSVGFVPASVAWADPVDASVRAAQALYDEGKYAEAEAAYIRITSEAPDAARAWFGLGSVRLHAQDFDGAVDVFARARALDPTLAAIVAYDTACAHALAGRPDAALEALSDAVGNGLALSVHIATDPDLASLRAPPYAERYARAIAPASVVALLARISGRDGTWDPRAELDARAQELCVFGEPSACALVGVDLRDPAAIDAALEPVCAGGHGEACLGVAWALLPGSLTGGRPGIPRDPARFVARVQRACSAGVTRGCTELGWVHLLGWLRYPNEGKARAVWQRACTDQDATACTAWYGLDGMDLAPAADNDPVAMLILAEAAPKQADALDAAACLVGARLGCARLAARTGALPADAVPRLEAACAENDLASCALVAQVKAVAGELSVDEAIARFDAACPLLDSACEEAAFLRQGAPPAAGYPPPPIPKLVVRGLFDVQEALHDCYVGALTRDHDAAAEVDAVLRLDGEGHVVGVYLGDALDPDWQTCVTDLLRTARIQHKGPPARVVTHLSAAHAAAVKVDTLNADGGKEAAVVAKDTPSWGAPLDECALYHGLVVQEELTIELFAQRDGVLRDVRLVEGLHDAEVEQCIVGWLANHRMERPVALGTPMRVRITLFQPGPAAEAGQVEPAPFPTVDADADPVTVKMLVLAVKKARLEGRRGALSARSAASIAKAHGEMAEAVERMTGGAVKIDVTFRRVRTTLVTHLDDKEGDARYLLTPNDLPLSVVYAVTPGEYDSLFVWAAIPRGFPRIHLGTTYGGVTVGGATLSSGLIPSRRELKANPGAPPYELPLHEWWHQVEQRGDALLGTGDAWPPRNHARLQVDGKWLEPRTWLGDATTAIPWYEHVLGEVLPAFWADVWSRGERIARSDANLALHGIAIGDGVYNVRGLVDSVLVFGRYPSPRTMPDAAKPWFGVEWPMRPEIGRLVAFVGSDDPWQDAVVQVDEGGDWRTVDAAVSHDGGVWTYTFPPATVRAVRLIPPGAPDDPHQQVVRELEVYAQ